MRSYKLEIKTIIFGVAVLSIVIFSLALVSLKMADFSHLGELLLHYGLLIAPITLLWVLLDKWMWHTKLLQALRKPFNIGPDIRGRWEGQLKSSQFNEPHEFVIEIKQSLTSLVVYAYSAHGSSKSILVDIAADEGEDHFVLCFLWQGEIPTIMEDRNVIQKFNGYTMLHIGDYNKPKTMHGTYFTDHQPKQTHGTIELNWTSLHLKRKL